jgi:hypothetical protein
MIADCCTPETASPSVEPGPIICPMMAIDLSRPKGRSRLFFIGCVCTVLVHFYALTLLATMLDVTFEDEGQLVNLINDDIGFDPDIPTNYNVDRIEDIDIPGPVMPNEAVVSPETADEPPAHDGR